MTRTLLLALLVGAPALLAGCAHSGDAAGLDPLPVKRVVLYQNGVGYFERAGTLHGDTLRLAVRPEQINDLLTSLTVIDRAGGRSQSISLPIDKSAAERLDELPPQVRQKGGLLSLLSAFKGARIGVTLDGGLRTLEGRVVGVENLEDKAHLALASKGSIANLELSKISRVKLLDRPLQVGLGKVLDHSLNQGKWKPVELTVRFDHDGRHDLLVSYVSEMPTWKPAYRLVLGKTGEGALLQGWAVIDNTSGENWRNVKLSLSSGAPISFRYDLHRPHFVTRPSVGVKHGGANAPVAAAGVGSGALDAVGSGSGGLSYRGRGSGGGGVAYGMGRIGGRAKVGKSGRKYPESAMKRKQSAKVREYEEEASIDFESVGLDELLQAQGEGARGAAMAGLFRYDVPGRVTVPDRSSTLVSLVNRKIEGEDLLLYRPEAGGAAARHPYRAVRFKNDTGYMLQGGPVTVLARGTFVGSGVFDRIEAEAESFLPFSMEQGVSINRSVKHGEQAVRLLPISGGQIRCETQSRRTQIFEVIRRAKDAPDRLYLRVGKRAGWTLEKKPEGTRELDNSWYIPATIGEGKTTVEITDLRKRPRQVSWNSTLGREVLAIYLSGDASPELRASIAKVDAVHKKLAELRSEQGQLVRKKSELAREQNRMRRNIKTLGEAKVNRKLANEFSKRLGANEAKIAKINAQLVKLSESIHAQESQLRVLIQAVSLGED